jgi:hypothetical protein
VVMTSINDDQLTISSYHLAISIEKRPLAISFFPLLIAN